MLSWSLYFGAASFHLMNLDKSFHFAMIFVRSDLSPGIFPGSCQGDAVFDEVTNFFSEEPSLGSRSDAEKIWPARQKRGTRSIAARRRSRPQIGCLHDLV
jgi:hypothetical protein